MLLLLLFVEGFVVAAGGRAEAATIAGTLCPSRDRWIGLCDGIDCVFLCRFTCEPFARSRISNGFGFGEFVGEGRFKPELAAA